MTPEQLREYISYNPVLGTFTWVQTTSSRVQMGNPAGGINSRDGYHEVTLHGKHWYGHRLAWYLTHGVLPRMIDHVNQDRGDNRISNLREVSYSDNAKNCGVSKNSTTKVTGVYPMPKNSGKWRAQITVNYKSIHLGVFDTQEEAIAARTAAKIEHKFHRNHS
jgi:hypothetical protein